MRHTIKAKITKEVNENITPSHRRENGFSEGYKVITRDFDEIVDCRIYWGSTRCYAVIWVHHKGTVVSGSGFAGGGGYHKQSAAVSDAISSAGIELSEAISGRGTRAMEDALTAIGKSFGYRKLKLVHIHE